MRGVIFTDFLVFKVVQKRIFEVSMITKSAFFTFFEEEILFQSVAEVVKIVKTQCVRYLTCSTGSNL